MVQPAHILLAIGAVGIILILMYSTSTGVGNKTLTAPVTTGLDRCPQSGGVPKPVAHTAVYKKSSYVLSSLPSVGSCPPGYTNFNDANGNYLCCASSKIDPYSHTCSALGAEGVCGMAPGIEDTRKVSGDIRHYPLCQAITKQKQQQNSGRYCPRRFPNYIAIPGVGNLYKCCAGPISPGGTDCMSPQSCSSLAPGQNIFTAPSSCEKEALLEKEQCPPGTNMVRSMKGTSNTMKNLTLPVCVGVTGNCFPLSVLSKLKDAGFLRDININTNIINCEIYNKVYNEKSISEADVETTLDADLS